ncbi:glycerophosphodiester phosphodiesterase [Bacillus timonensis]|nr:glycerophosphodiester phosphodiesterase [Bacillus timonensis]
MMKINKDKNRIIPIYFRLAIAVFLIGLFFITIQFLPVSKQSNTAFLREGERPLVIAHRGGAGLAPENTMLAFRVAEKIGVDAIELDVRMSKDGHVVVIHDETVDRTTNGTGYVNKLTLEQIKKLDAGYRLKLEKGAYPFRNKGVTIPTLEEVFKQIRNVPLVIELKDPNKKLEAEVAKLIKKYKMKKRVIVGSFNDNSLERFASKTDGKIPVGTGVETIKYFLFLHKIHLDRLLPLKRHAVQIPVKVGRVDLATERLIKRVRERNIAIHFWTINDEKTMRQLIELNVDGIITDYPNLLIQLLEEERKEI